MSTPVVVLQGGGFSSIDTWDPVFTDVAAFASALAYERRGIGQSEWDGKPQTPGRVAGQLQALFGEVEAPGLYDSLGGAYRAAGRPDAARRHYERAVALAKEQGHPDLKTFRANLKQVTKQLEEKN